MRRAYRGLAVVCLLAFLATGCGRQKMKAGDGGAPKPQALAPTDGTPKNMRMPGAH